MIEQRQGCLLDLATRIILRATRRCYDPKRLEVSGDRSASNLRPVFSAELGEVQGEDQRDQDQNNYKHCNDEGAQENLDQGDHQPFAEASG
jgi:hypothetical protein